MAYIRRAVSDILKNRVMASKCTLITGARQVGKSTLIRHEFPGYNRANFDDSLTRLQARDEPKLFFLNNPCPLFDYSAGMEPVLRKEHRKTIR